MAIALLTTGTFTEYMDSLATEIRRLLSTCDYTVEVKDDFWSTEGSEDGKATCKIIYISENNGGPSIHFSIATLEFKTLQRYASKVLIDIATIRLTDIIEGFKHLYSTFGEMITKLEVGIVK